MRGPGISIIMPARDAQATIREAIESVLKQTFRDFELIVIDDASSDGTSKVVKEFSDSRVNLIELQITHGIGEALNLGMSSARGEFLARMDADDISLPNRLQKQLEFLSQRKDIDIVGSWSQAFGVADYLEKVPITHADLMAEMAFSCPLVHPTIMISRHVARDKLQYDKAYTVTEDYELWSRLIFELKFENIPSVLLKRRRSAQHESGSAYRAEQQRQGDKIRSGYIRRLGIKTDDAEISLHNQLSRGEFSALIGREKEMMDWIVKIDSHLASLDLGTPNTSKILWNRAGPAVRADGNLKKALHCTLMLRQLNSPHLALMLSAFMKALGLVRRARGPRSRYSKVN